MASKREFHAATERNALYGRDARLPHRLDLAKRKLCIARQDERLVERVDLLEHLPNVGPGDERRSPLPGEHHSNDIVLARQMIDHDHQFVDRTFVQRVHRWIGDGDGRDALARRNDVVLDQEIAVALEQRLFFGQALLALPVVDRDL
jgi:hypothetical protein